VAIATYNEIETLPRLVEAILQMRSDLDVLIVDDNSPDGTGDWCEEQAASAARLKLIRRPEKLGVGSAVRAAIEFAIKHGYRFLVNMDGDFSHDPSYLDDLIRQMEPNPPSAQVPDVVVASRYVTGGGVRNWPVHRRAMSRLVNHMARRLLGLSVRDCSGSFRCYRVESFARIRLDDIQSHGYSFFEEILWRLEASGALILEVPYVFVNRERGTSKSSPREAILAAYSLIKLATLRLTSR
jgi:dolichol-phosphate mannosyltransferase